MKMNYDKEANAAYIYLGNPIKEKGVKKVIELNESIILDFDEDDKLIGIEVLNADKVLNSSAFSEKCF